MGRRRRTSFRVRKVLQDLRSSLAYRPAVFALLAVGLALVTRWIDGWLPQGWGAGSAWLGLASAEAGRAVLPTLAASSVTVAGVVFSITAVGLSMTTANFGPRLLRNFMRSSGTQTVLGTFVGTFVLQVLALGTLYPAVSAVEGPRLSIAAAFLMSIVSFGVLIFYFHHLTSFLQVERILDDVAADLADTVEHLFPPREEGTDAGQDVDVAAALPPGFPEAAAIVAASRSGYVQAVEEKRLAAIAEAKGLTLHLAERPGRFIHEGDALLRATPAPRLTPDIEAALARCILVGSRRTSAQDPEFAVEQVVDIALRALSPGINDSGTAMACVDRLGAVLASLAKRRIPSPLVRGEAGRVLLVAERDRFGSIVDAAFDRIRQNAGGKAAVLARILETIEHVAGQSLPEDMRRHLLDQADQVTSSACESLARSEDREDVTKRHRRVQALLEAARRD